MSTLKSENVFLRLERSLEAVAPGLVKHSRLCVKRLSCRLSKLVAFALEPGLVGAHSTSQSGYLRFSLTLRFLLSVHSP